MKWQFSAGLGIIGAPISHGVHGKQYVSLLVGYGGATAALEPADAGWLEVWSAAPPAAYFQPGRQSGTATDSSA